MDIIIDQKGLLLELQSAFGLFSKKNNLAKCYIWGMICKGNLILRTMVLEYFNNASYFKSYRHFFRKN